jgi:glucose 1-dehydrogenase
VYLASGEILLGHAPSNLSAGMPGDVASVVVWLCSNDAAYINGNVISIDGGLNVI